MNVAQIKCKTICMTHTLSFFALGGTIGRGGRGIWELVLGCSSSGVNPFTAGLLPWCSRGLVLGGRAGGGSVESSLGGSIPEDYSRNVCLSDTWFIAVVLIEHILGKCEDPKSETILNQEQLYFVVTHVTSALAVILLILIESRPIILQIRTAMEENFYALLAQMVYS